MCNCLCSVIVLCGMMMMMKGREKVQNKADYWLAVKLKECVCVPMLTQQHYYALGVPHKADRWHWVWSIFDSCTTWADHITCGTSVRWWWWKEGRRWNPVPAHSLLLSKSTKGAARLNVPIRQTNCYQQYYMPSQHTYCGRVWNLTQDCDVQCSD